MATWDYNHKCDIISRKTGYFSNVPQTADIKSEVFYVFLLPLAMGNLYDYVHCAGRSTIFQYGLLSLLPI